MIMWLQILDKYRDLLRGGDGGGGKADVVVARVDARRARGTPHVSQSLVLYYCGRRRLVRQSSGIHKQTF